MYQVFIRNWWTENPDYPNGLEPRPGRKTIIDEVSTIEEAREIAQDYNATHDPGRLSRKAEFEEIR